MSSCVLVFPAAVDEKNRQITQVEMLIGRTELEVSKEELAFGVAVIGYTSRIPASGSRDQSINTERQAKRMTQDEPDDLDLIPDLPFIAHGGLLDLRVIYHPGE